jgi:hypothetical protein
MSQELRHKNCGRISKELLHSVVTLSFSRPLAIFYSNNWDGAGLGIRVTLTAYPGK